jgi:hypothetical protein
MHACMLWLLPVSTLQCGFPHLGRMKTTKYFTCRTQFPCMSHHMNNLPKDATGYIYPILNRDSFCKPERKKEKKVVLYVQFQTVFFFSLSAQHNTKFESHRVAYSPTEFVCKNLQRISPATSSSHTILVRACLHLITIHSHDLQISTFKEEN